MTRPAPLYPVVPGAHLDLAALDPAHTGDYRNRNDAREDAAADLERLHDLQERLYIDGRHALLVVLQGMDTSGKDGLIRHLSHGFNLQGTEVMPFKAPSENERRYDFLWRVHHRVPPKGWVGIFNRSHYEDVLVPRVEHLLTERQLDARVDAILAFEQLLADSGTVIVKFFLHISRDEQKERLQARLDDPAKLWKFDPRDLEGRARWTAYQSVYADTLARTSREHAPWLIVPADKKWYRNLAVTRHLIGVLESLDLRLPHPTVDPALIHID